MTGPDQDVSLCLQAMKNGDHSAADRLFPHIYQGLRELADAAFRQQRPDQTLQPTALVHEAYLRLMGAAGNYEDRQHFFGVAAKAMRQILIDHARGRGRQKRGGNQERLALQDDVAFDRGMLPEDAVVLGEALQRLEATDPRLAQVFELRHLSGLETEEIAKIVGRAPRTVRLDCKMAVAWLRKHLQD